MFFGESSHVVDDKGRVHLPKRITAEIPEGEGGRRTVYVTRGFEGCLFLFTEEGFQEALRRLLVQPFAGAEARKMQRLFFSQAHKLPVDRTGRLLVPEPLRERVGLEKQSECVVVGVVDRVELWPRRAWERFQAAHDDEFDRLDQVLCPDPLDAAEEA